jgi:hypothetical protein
VAADGQRQQAVAGRGRFWQCNSRYCRLG